jgi:hypothetical protein
MQWYENDCFLRVPNLLCSMTSTQSNNKYSWKQGYGDHKAYVLQLASPSVRICGKQDSITRLTVAD